jgi:hypothetical protein
MKHRTLTSMAILTVLSAALVMGVACGNGDGPRAVRESPLELRSYEIEPDLSRELRSILNEALVRGEGQAPVGRATVGPNGRLIVAAPAEVLATVEDLVEEIRSAAPSRSPVVGISYWMVEGRPAAETTYPNRLTSVVPALEGIASVDGPTAFQLDEKIVLRSMSGDHATASGRNYHVAQRSSERGDEVYAEIQIQGHGRRTPSIQLGVRLTPGELLVLGQTGIRDAGGDEDSGITLYYIVQAETLGRS